MAGERLGRPVSRRAALGLLFLQGGRAGEAPPASLPASSTRRRPVALGPAGLVIAVAATLVATWGGCAARTRVKTPQPGAMPAEGGEGPAPAGGTAKGVELGTSGPTAKPNVVGRPIRMTMYHVATEPCPDPPQATIPRCGGGILASVSHAFRKSVTMQGTGKLCDGRLIGVQKVNPLCFVVVDPKYPWGLTASGHPATPFRSIGVDPKDLPYGHWYYVRELDGVTLPFPDEGKKHDGCVRADDTGNGIGENHVDLFVGPKSAMTPELVKIVQMPVTIAPGEGICTGKDEF